MTDGDVNLLYKSSWKFHQLAAGQPLLGQPIRYGKGRLYLPSTKYIITPAGSLSSSQPHPKKRFRSFPSPAGMSLTKLPLGRNISVMTSLFPPRESLVVTSRLETGNSRTFFLRCRLAAFLGQPFSLRPHWVQRREIFCVCSAFFRIYFILLIYDH